MPDVLSPMVSSRYENADIALNCGMMLRECVRVQELADIILKSPEFYKFFDCVQKSTFDIASDAFATFKVRPTTNPLTNSCLVHSRIY